MATVTKKKVNAAKGKAAVEASRGKVMKFRVKEGIHRHGSLVWTKDMVLSSRFELDKMFINKFERLHEDVPADKGIADFKYQQQNMRPDMPKLAARKSLSLDPEALDVEEPIGDPSEDELADAHSEFLRDAKDVTDQFEFVKEEANGLRVLQNGKRFGVVSEDHPHELLNKHQPLRRKEVNAFVEKFLDNELDDPEENDEDGTEDEE